MPQAMNSAAKRLGNSGTPRRAFPTAPLAGSCAKLGSDSSHGNATATPAPRRIVRREMRGMLLSALIQKLPAGDDLFQQAGESIAVSGEPAAHGGHRGIIGRQEGPAQGVG